jgi:hypothetical protein
MEDHRLEQRLDAVLNSLRRLRVNPIIEEYALQDMIRMELDKAGISCAKEYRLGPRNRIDFLVEGGIGIEVKKGKPNRKRTLGQLERYLASDEIKILILVVERSLTIPSEVKGKRCISFGVNRNWGIAL